MNTGTSGPMPQAAIDAMRRSVEQNGEPRITRAYFESLLGGREVARAAAGRAVGAPPEEIALTTSTTLGIGLVMSGLDWREGDEIVTTTEEHPGILSPLDVLRQRYGVVPRFVDAGDVAEAVNDRTKMVAISHVLWTTGRTLDLQPIADAVHAVGGLLLVDGAQSAGNIAVDVAATGADAYAFSGQKWLLGPLGSGALWVSPELTQRIWPVTSGYLNLEGGEIGKFKTTAGRLDGGTNDPATVAGFTAALEWVEGLPGGRARWVEQIAANAAAARERLAEVPGLELGTGQRQRPGRVHARRARGHGGAGGAAGRARACSSASSRTRRGCARRSAPGRRPTTSRRWRPRYPGSPRSVAIGRSAPITNAMCSFRSTPSSSAPRVTSSRLTPLAKLGCLSFLRTDFGSSVDSPSGRTNPHAWTNPDSSSHAYSVCSSSVSRGTPVWSPCDWMAWMNHSG